MKNVLLFGFIAFLLAACTKEGQLLRRIDGNYTVTMLELSGEGGAYTSVPTDGMSMRFESCKKQDNSAGGSCRLQVTLDGTTLEYTYQIGTDSGDGQIITLNSNENGSANEGAWMKALGLFSTTFDLKIDGDNIELTCATCPTTLDGQTYQSRDIQLRRE